MAKRHLIDGKYVSDEEWAAYLKKVADEQAKVAKAETTSKSSAPKDSSK